MFLGGAAASARGFAAAMVATERVLEPFYLVPRVKLEEADEEKEGERTASPRC